MKNHKTETTHSILNLKPVRVGKIARLPASIREQLNRRLENGSLGKKIISWLNTLPEVNQIMAEQFAGKPISENNLSEWRRGGYQDWLREQEDQEWTVQFVKKAMCMEPAARLRYIENLIAAQFMKELEALRNTDYDDVHLRHFERLTQGFLRIQKHHTLEHQSKLREAIADSLRARKRCQTLPTL
jgi:hypothetical protein